MRETLFATDRQAPAPAAVDQISLWELEQQLHITDPAAILAPPRILRRVIKQHAGVSRIGLRVPHRKCYVISREDLLAIVEPWELDLPPGSELSETVLLLARPTNEHFEESPAADVLLRTWRLLFHARVHAVLDGLVTDGRLSRPEIERRIREIGETEFNEIRAVLKAEDYLLEPENDAATYLEFVAVYLELRHFAPQLVRTYFPAIEDFGYIDDVLRRDIDAQAWLEATRLAGAAVDTPTNRPQLAGPEATAHVTFVPQTWSPNTFDRLMAQADRAAQRGNHVRSAFLRKRAARFATSRQAARTSEAASADLARLATRLERALDATPTEGQGWLQVMGLLLDRSVESRWSAAGRMLYDLQRVCIDRERGIYTLHVWPWIKTLGKTSPKRWLPGQRYVLMSKHLRTAQRRLPAIDLPLEPHARLTALLEGAAGRAQQALRSRFRPTLLAALDEVQLVPKNLPEQIARNKLVDELLDRVIERGFLSMSDLRDALSRNNLKLPDLSNPRQLLTGDQLLAADRRLSETMDGVYRRGEIYLRLPQILSSLAFGTALGRLITRFIAIPFGGAFLVLEGLQHIVTIAADSSHASEVHLRTTTSVLALGLLLLGLTYYDRFRQACLTAARALGVVARKAFVELPRRVIRLPLVQAIVSSRYFKAARQYFFKPAVITGLVLLVVGALERSINPSGAVVLFAFVNLLINSRLGRNVDEVVMDWTASAWHRFRIHVVASFVRSILDVFSRILETIERMLYAVDEWLRFRTGEGRGTVAIKAVLGFVWTFVHYIVRFCVNLLIEPQINPIKHFPVVTVSHKIILPFTYTFIASLTPILGAGWARTVAPPIVLLLPGVFGFLVWELKENWRLYAANRRRNLLPTPVGHHGESVLQLMKPGFRSGTLPKAYHRLRRGHRRALARGDWKTPAKQLNVLEHVKVAMQRFADRELAELLMHSHGWDGVQVSAADVRLATNRILVELYCPDLAEQSMWIAFEERGGWLVASIHLRGWLDKLTFEQRTTLASALTGFYKIAGVDLVREQIESHLPAHITGYEIEEQGLVIRRFDGGQDVLPVYDWAQGVDSRPYPAAANDRGLDRRRLVFGRARLSWRRWVTAWEADRLRGGTTQQVVDGRALLPHGI